jgi:glycine/D-amino acid oxidase-like deaminating enzyme
MRVDFLIVGQGLAGSLLAWKLLQSGAQVLLLDEGENNASRVAAGLINPVTGMRLVKTPGVDSLLPEAVALYRQLEQRFAAMFYVEKPLLRILANDEERRYAQKRSADAGYRHYIERLSPPENFAPFGSLVQKRSGYLLTTALLDSLRDFFRACGAYRAAALTYEDLAVAEECVQWQDVRARRAVFCEGYRCRNNPWFAWLPLQPVKGEILTLRGAPLPECIVNYGQWLIPLDGGLFRVGATFDREHLDTLPTESAKQQLLGNLQTHCPQVNVTGVLSQHAGIRPTTLDKQPFLGAHPRFSQLSIFNGFGAKGSLSIPYYARRFADFLLHGAALPATADVQRHVATHFPG